MKLSDALAAYKSGDSLTLRGGRLPLGLSHDILESTEWDLEPEVRTLASVADQLERLRGRVGSSAAMDELTALASKLRAIEAEREKRLREAELAGVKLSRELAKGQGD